VARLGAAGLARPIYRAEYLTVFHAHAFNIALLVAVVPALPGTARAASTKSVGSLRRQIGAVCQLAIITLAMSVVTIFFFFFFQPRLPVTIMTHTIITIKSLNANDAIDALLALCRFARIRQRDACARSARR